MGSPFRSPVPDLLFEDEQARRVAEIAPLLEAPERVGPGTPLHRITVFLTYRCNLACPYCKTIARTPEELEARPEKRVTSTLDDLRALLDAHGGAPVRHLHFTGGEAATVPGLAERVRLAKDRGVERVSLTTNGTLPPEVYLGLIDAGLDEIRVSLDAAEPVLGRDLTRRRGAFRAAVRTLRALSDARGAPAPRRFFLIINTVVGALNRKILPEIVRSFLSFAPDDLKLITEVDARGALGDFPEAEGVLRDLRALLEPYPTAAFPLLRRKLQTVFAPDAVGLEAISPAAGPRDFRCYIPLTERTVDGVYYYPCSVYLREGGRPLGRIDEPQELQRQKSAHFVRHGDCLSDPICQRYCLHCTRSYNVRANEARA